MKYYLPAAHTLQFASISCQTGHSTHALMKSSISKLKICDLPVLCFILVVCDNDEHGLCSCNRGPRTAER